MFVSVRKNMSIVFLYKVPFAMLVTGGQVSVKQQ